MAISISQKKSTKRAHASKKKDMQTSSTARKSSRSFLGNVALLVFLFVLGFLFFFPVLYMLNQSLKPLNEIRYWVGQVLGAEPVETLDKVEGKNSVVKQLYINHEKAEIDEKKSQNQNTLDKGR